MNPFIPYTSVPSQPFHSIPYQKVYFLVWALLVTDLLVFQWLIRHTLYMVW